MTNEQIKLLGRAIVAFGATLAGETVVTHVQSKAGPEAVSKAISEAQEPEAQTQVDDAPKAKDKKKNPAKQKTGKQSTTSTADAAPIDGNEAKQAESNGAASYSHDDLRKELVEFAKKHGKAAAYELLSEFGAKKAIEVPEDKLGLVFTRMAGRG